MAATVVLSSVVAHLDPDSRVRYIQKLALAGVSDPYDIPSNLFIAIDRHARFDDKTLPQLSYIDIANYLVFSTSYYTSANMKAFKSLEAYKYFVAGWVHGLQTWSIPEKQRVLVMAKVCQIVQYLFCCLAVGLSWRCLCGSVGALTLLIYCRLDCYSATPPPLPLAGQIPDLCNLTHINFTVVHNRMTVIMYICLLLILFI